MNMKCFLIYLKLIHEYRDDHVHEHKLTRQNEHYKINWGYKRVETPRLRRIYRIYFNKYIESFIGVEANNIIEHCILINLFYNNEQVLSKLQSYIHYSTPVTSKHLK